MTQEAYDVVVIGGGPGGYVAAIRAAQMGLKTAVVEKAHLGGVCLNWGCIPTKALLRTSEVYHLMHRLEDFGLSAKNVSFDIEKIVARSRDVATRLAKGVAHLMKKNKITVIEGYGRLKGKGGIEVTTNANEKKLLSAKQIILATGARPRDISGLEADGKLVWNSAHAMVPKEMPKSLGIIGSGAIGVEFASFYAAFGVKVHLIEMQDRIVPVEDEEVSKELEKAFVKRGIAIYTNTKCTLDKQKNSVRLKLEGKQAQTLEVDSVIVAIGVQGNIEDLGLEHTKVRTDKGMILTGPHGETDESGVYAIGDVTSPPWLAHKASHEGVLSIAHAKGDKSHKLIREHIPGCTYCMPQIASIGLTEKKAKDAGRAIKVGRFPYMANGKAIAMGEEEGFVKTIFDAKTGELLGAHIIGAEATELIQGFAIAMSLETTEEELMHTVFPHPTLSEMMHESVLDAFGRVIHF